MVILSLLPFLLPFAILFLGHNEGGWRKDRQVVQKGGKEGEIREQRRDDPMNK